jgi:hypothetical protein
MCFPYRDDLYRKETGGGGGRGRGDNNKRPSSKPSTVTTTSPPKMPKKVAEAYGEIGVRKQNSTTCTYYPYI